VTNLLRGINANLRSFKQGAAPNLVS